MLTIIIPGFSIKNKDWAEETKNSLDAGLAPEVIYFKHWETGQFEENWIENETDRIINTYRGQQINIIAKSIGTAVAMNVVKTNKENSNKVILCGIPMLDFTPGTDEYYAPLANVNTDNFLIIQNENDSHGAYPAAEKFIHSINPDLKIVVKPRSDHEYPYWDEFKEFLVS